MEMAWMQSFHEGLTLAASVDEPIAISCEPSQEKVALTYIPHSEFLAKDASFWF